MGTTPTPNPAAPSDAARRRGVRRTVLVMGSIALLIYLGFVASGVIGR